MSGNELKGPRGGRIGTDAGGSEMAFRAGMKAVAGLALAVSVAIVTVVGIQWIDKRVDQVAAHT